MHLFHNLAVGSRLRRSCMYILGLRRRLIEYRYCRDDQASVSPWLRIDKACKMEVNVLTWFSNLVALLVTVVECKNYGAKGTSGSLISCRVSAVAKQTWFA